jgi:hypothetical protein
MLRLPNGEAKYFSRTGWTGARRSAESKRGGRNPSSPETIGQASPYIVVHRFQNGGFAASRPIRSTDLGLLFPDRDNIPQSSE